MCRWTVQEAIGRPHAGLPCTVFLAPFISHCSPLVARTLLTPSVRLPAANMAAHLCASSKAAVMGRRQPFVAAAGAAARSVRPLQVVAAKPAKAAEFRCAARPKCRGVRSVRLAEGPGGATAAAAQAGEGGHRAPVVHPSTAPMCLAGTSAASRLTRGWPSSRRRSLRCASSSPSAR